MNKRIKNASIQRTAHVITKFLIESELTTGEKMLTLSKVRQMLITHMAEVFGPETGKRAS